MAQKRKKTNPVEQVTKPVPAPQKGFCKDFFKNPTSQLWIIALFALALYGNTLLNEYALDDGLVLTDNKFVQQGISGIADIFTHDSFYGSLEAYNNLPGGRYRPLSLAAFAIEVSIFGNNPFVHHLINVLIYALTCVMLFLFLRKFIFKNDKVAAFIAALLFAVHPIHTEAVANIKSRDELFSLLFLLLTLYYLLAFISLSGNKIHYLLSIVSYLLALFSKENGLTFVAIIPATLYWFTDKKIKSIALLSLPFLLSAFFYTGIRILLIGLRNNEVREVMDNPYLLATVSQKYATILFVLLKYLQLLSWPNPLTYDYSYNQVAYRNFNDPSVLFSILILLIMIGYTLITFRKKDLIGWCILFYLATIFIISNLVFNIGAPMAERFLYQASVAFVIFIAEIARRLLHKVSWTIQTKTAIASVAASFFIIVASYATVKRNATWKSDKVLFLHDVKVSGQSARANTYAGVALIKLCDESNDTSAQKTYAREALGYFRRSSAIKENYITTLLNTGVAYSRLDSVEKAEEAWNKAREINPNDRNLPAYDQYLAESYYHMGLVAGTEKKIDSSIIYLGKSVKYGPGNADAWYNLGGAYFTAQNYPKARSSWEKAIELNPQQRQATEGLNALRHMGF